MKYVIKNRQYLQACLQNAGEAAADASDSKPYELIIQPIKTDRSAAQNRLSFMWYSQLGKQTGHGKEHERNHCKWNYGYPILMAREDVDPVIVKIYRILMRQPYEDRVDAMDMVDVTSLFKVKEFAEYLNSIERYAAQAGVALTHPEDLYWAAIGATRRKPRGES